MSGVRRTERAAPPAVPRDAGVVRVWPNGSGVFAHLAEAGRVELGRVVRDGGKWRIWRKRGEEYRAQGSAPSQSAAILALLEAATPAPARPRAAALGIGTRPRLPSPQRGRRAAKA